MCLTAVFHLPMLNKNKVTHANVTIPERNSGINPEKRSQTLLNENKSKSPSIE